MTEEERNDALRKLVHALDHTAEPDPGPAAERTAGSAADQVEHHAPPKSSEVPSVYALGSMRGPKSVQLRAAYLQMVRELTSY